LDRRLQKETSLPLYEYRCSSCGQSVDIKHGFKETVSDPCAACGGPLVRVFNPAGIVFKGSGFYVTDSRPKSSEGGSSSTASDSKPAESKSSETKPAESKPSGKSDAAA
jgi:putative FmdB family regulatory protein